MPRDQRLYMTFPISFDEHPKVAVLTDAAFRAFIEMNAYSRRNDLDGYIPAMTARKRWKVRILAELVASHPERPLVTFTDEVYFIRDYADHQLTVADIEDLRDKRSEAGSRGGKAKAANKQTASKALAIALAKSKQTASKHLAESESESESGLNLTDISKFPESSHLPDRAEMDSDSIGDLVSARAKLAGITDLATVRRNLERATEHPVSRMGAVLLAEAITSKAPTVVKRVDAYVAKACRTTPDEVKEAFFDLDIEGVA